MAGTDVGSLAIRLGILWDKKAAGQARDNLGRFAKQAETKMGRLASMLKSKLAPLVGITAAVFATRDALRFSTALARLDITAKGGLGTFDQLQGKLLKVSDATGVTKENVLQSTSKFIELTGNVKMAGEQMELFSKVQQATGANADDVAGSAAAMSEQFKISGTDFEKMFSILIEGGKAGSAEFKDMSAYMAGLGAAAQKFANSEGIDAAAEIGAALQIVSGTTGGNVAEATTQIKALFTGLGQASSKLKKHGVQVFDASGEYRELSTIFKELKDKGLSVKEIEALFPNVRAQRGALALLRGDWEGLTKATMKSNAVAEDYKKISQNSAVKLTKAWNKFKNMVTKVFVVMVDAMSWIVDNSLPIGIAIGSLTGAIIAYNQAMIVAAIKTAWFGRTALMTWIELLAPIILVAVAIAALMLLVQDLWSWFNGGRSVLKDLFHGPIMGWMQEFTDFIDWIKNKLSTVSDIVTNITGNRGQKNAVDNLEEQVYGDSKAGKTFERAKKKFGVGFAINQLRSAGLDNTAEGKAIIGKYAPEVAASGKGSGGVSTSLVVHIEGGANVDDSTVTKIVDQTQAAMARTARQLASEAQ